MVKGMESVMDKNIGSRMKFSWDKNPACIIGIAWGKSMLDKDVYIIVIGFIWYSASISWRLLNRHC